MSYGRVLKSADYVKEVVAWAHGELVRLDINQVVVTGTSGLVPASVLMTEHGISLVYIRKPEEKQHSSGDYIDTNKPFVILDDFIASGESMRRILRATHPKMPEAILLYGSYSDSPYFEDDDSNHIPIIYRRWTT